MSANRISAPVAALFEQMNLRYAPPAGAGLPTVSPGTGEELARLPLTDMAEADASSSPVPGETVGSPAPAGGA